MGRKHKPVVAIDIGTTKVSAIAAEIEQDGISVIGASTQPSHGVRKGIIINMDSTIDSVKTAVEELETMAGIDVRSAVIGVSGSHIKGFCNNGAVALTRGEVRKNDLTAVMEAAKAVVIPTDREVIQILPQEFVLDDQDGIRDPLGMAGTRLEARVYIATGAVGVTQNIIRCLNRSAVKVGDMILQHIASADAVLSADERELGCVLVDIGGGTTDIAVFFRGSLRFCATLPIGGVQITSDIAIGLRTPIADAEEIKKSFGNAAAPPADPGSQIQAGIIGESGSKTVSHATLNQIITARVDETFGLIKKELSAAGCLEHLPAGIVITGGSALLTGMCEAAGRTLGMPARIGLPAGFSGLNDVKGPQYASSTGLALCAARDEMPVHAPQTAQTFLLGGIGSRMKQWFAEAF